MRDVWLGSAAVCSNLVTFHLPQQPPSVNRALRRSQFQPVSGFLRLIDRRQSAKPTIFELSIAITGSRGLAQQFVADAAIPGVAAVTAKHLPEPTLRHDHPVAGGLFQKTASEMFDAGLLIQARVIQQP